MFAAQELYRRAIAKSDLTTGSVETPWVTKFAKRHKAAVTAVQIEVEIENSREMIKEFTTARLNDTGCFAITMRRLEVELTVMRARANARAMGASRRCASCRRTIRVHPASTRC